MKKGLRLVDKYKIPIHYDQNEHRPDEKGIATTSRRDRAGRGAGTNTDLMKKGLRPGMVGRCGAQAANEHRPDEKGIATSGHSLQGRS